MARPVKDLRGERFGRLVVLGLDSMRPNVRQNIPHWLCRCDCGVEKVVSGHSLKAKVTLSCGCYNVEKSTKHGMERSKVYQVWASMKQRCQNPKHRAYKDYGGRGISVCDRWQDFRNFYADMGDPAGILDRIDNDGNYEPGNVRWASWSMSNKNQRRHLS